jgi:UDP-N-acetylmuramate dehydrogenase
MQPTILGAALAPLTTLRLGGPARRLVTLEDERELPTLLEEATRASEPVLILGGGSNLVVADAGFPGLVVRMATRGVQIGKPGTNVRVSVAAGELFDALVERAVAEGLAGLECLAGIPGLVGATPMQNVGAYGQEVADTIVEVRVFDREHRSFEVLPAGACGFAYRHSIFRRSPRYVVLEVVFELEVGQVSRPVRYAELARLLAVGEGARVPLREAREAVIRLRRAKGMVLDSADPDSVSVGSFFTNPVLDSGSFAALMARAPEAVPPHFRTDDGRYKVPAAWLCERAGFGKGHGDGRVGVSTKHSLALVNRGGATTQELVQLARRIRDGVRERFGLTLEPEPIFVGLEL